MSSSRRTLAVALHDIEPATFERCALIRDWLDDHGVNHVTLLVIPARDLHPLAERSPEMVSWLIERERDGDAIAQHGFQHLRSPGTRRRGGGMGAPYQYLRTIGANHETEFVGLDAQETQRAVDAGRRVLKLAGIEPRGFVAPGYAYTPALRQTLSERFHWWTGLLGLHRARPTRTQSASVQRRAERASRAARTTGRANELWSSAPCALPHAAARGRTHIGSHTARGPASLRSGRPESHACAGVGPEAFGV